MIDNLRVSANPSGLGKLGIVSESGESFRICKFDKLKIIGYNADMNTKTKNKADRMKKEANRAISRVKYLEKIYLEMMQKKQGVGK